MIRSTCTIIVLIAYVLGSHSIISAGMNYLCNYRYFAEHCINKNKPELECDGKCGLMEEMNEQDDSQNTETDVLHHIVNLPALKIVEHIHSEEHILPLPNEGVFVITSIPSTRLQKGFSRLPLNPPRA